ncbi:unnamed protein product [Gordionus sp. m RMFG-2023]
MANVCLIVIDGWGLRNDTKGNAISKASTSNMDSLSKREGQSIKLCAHGLGVGLPKDLMGNSEVGHLNIGAGRVIYQDIVRINMSIEDKSLFSNKKFVEMCNQSKNGTNRLHFIGLVSDGGVHSHIDHLFALLEGAKTQGIKNTFVHAITDGRDTLPCSGSSYLKQLEDYLSKKLKHGKLATVVGRFYAMDRDKRWERIKVAYEALIQGIGVKIQLTDLFNIMEAKYNGQGEEKQTDEFLKPIIIEDGIDNRIKDGDTVFFFNYRADRMREIVECIGLKPQFDTNVIPKNLVVYSMTEYKKDFKLPVLFSPVFNKNVLAEWLASKNIPQFHCAETEKYAHVTFFFNGGREEQFNLEERKMIPSPKVKTYDLKPEMSCMEVAMAVSEALKCGKYAFVMCNFAPPDMVGHTGSFDAAVEACQFTDKAIGIVEEACKQYNFTMMVTADHGNAEEMIAPDGGPFTQHTCNPVPLLLTGFRKFDPKFVSPEKSDISSIKDIKTVPALCDVAPTILDLMGLDQPEEMTGHSLLLPSY